MDFDRYWNIILFRTYAELKAEAQLNYMGYVWWLLEPLLNTVLFYVILVFVLEQNTADAISFILVAAVTWQWFSGSVLATAGSIFDAGGMLKQIYLPKVVLPLISIFTSLWKFGFVFVCLLIWVWVSGHAPSAAYVALPLLLGLEFLVIVFTSLPLAAITPYFPDARVSMDSLLRSLMLVSGIFFPVEKISPQYHIYFYVNPMAILIEAYRSILLHGNWPNWRLLSWVAIYCAIMMVLSVWLYVRIDRSIVKAIHR